MKNSVKAALLAVTIAFTSAAATSVHGQPAPRQAAQDPSGSSERKAVNYTDLHQAAWDRNLTLVKALVEEKAADVNAVAVFWSKYDGSVDPTTLIPKEGNFRPVEWATPLDIAVDAYESSMVKYLISKGGMPAQKNRADTLAYLAFKGDIQSVRTLIAKGISPQEKGSKGYSLVEYLTPGGSVSTPHPAMIYWPPRDEFDNIFSFRNEPVADELRALIGARPVPSIPNATHYNLALRELRGSKNKDVIYWLTKLNHPTLGAKAHYNLASSHLLRGENVYQRGGIAFLIIAAAGDRRAADDLRKIQEHNHWLSQYVPGLTPR